MYLTHRNEIGVIYFAQSIVLILVPLLLCLCGIWVIRHVTNPLHALCAHWNEKSSCFLSFRVSQSPMNVHLIILFRERQACQALVWCWECFCFDFSSTSNKTSNCMYIFKLHLGEDAFGQPTYCNRSFKKRAKQLNCRPDHKLGGLCLHKFT